MKTPKDQTSIDHDLDKLYFLFIVSGGKYSCVAMWAELSFSNLWADPKSIIFKSKTFSSYIKTSIFSGFKSLWTIFKSDKTYNALKIIFINLSNFYNNIFKNIIIIANL